MKLVRFDCPTASIPSSWTAAAVAIEASDSAIAAKTPPWTRPYGCLSLSVTGMRPRVTSAVHSISSNPRVPSRVFSHGMALAGRSGTRGRLHFRVNGDFRPAIGRAEGRDRARARQRAFLRLPGRHARRHALARARAGARGAHGALPRHGLPGGPRMARPAGRLHPRPAVRPRVDSHEDPPEALGGRAGLDLLAARLARPPVRQRSPARGSRCRGRRRPGAPPRFPGAGHGAAPAPRRERERKRERDRDRARPVATAAAAEKPAREPLRKPEGGPLSAQGGAVVRRRRIVGAGIGVLAIVGIVALVLALTGGDDNKKSSAKSSTGSSQPVRVIGELALSGPNGAKGAAAIAQRGNQKQLILQAKLPPSKKGEAYVVWLFNSPQDAVSVGAQVADKSGNFVGAGPLPANYQRYKFIDVTRQPVSASATAYGGTSVLRGALANLITPQQAQQQQGQTGTGTTPQGGTGTTP